MSASNNPVLTIGHSTHSLGGLAALLTQHGVTAVVDVRSAPYSRFNPQFNKEPFAQYLKSIGIEYVFLGKELGARSDNPYCYVNGRVQFTRLASTDLFRAGIERVVRGSSNFKIALLCAEKDPLECHRTLLVSRVLVDLGVVVNHILSDGCIEPHAVAMERLIDVVGLHHGDLFRSKEDMIAEALACQEERIAYSKVNSDADSVGEAS